MPRLTKLALVLTTLILLSFAAPAVNATTLIIGSSNDLSRYPFGRDPGNASGAFPDFGAGGTYQQVYASSAFSGPVTITQIAFASKSQLTSGPGTATYNFNIALSTTAVGPNGLSTNLAANRGADLVQVFSGPFTATITANNQFDLVIDITPFTYNPANGNLLLDVAFNAPTQFTGGSVLYYNAGFSASTSRAANPSGGAGGAFTDGFGLETRFTTKGTAQITLGNLEQTFDGSPKSVAVTTDPPDLEVVVTYDGSATPPANAGSYAVAAVVNDPNFFGQASGNLTISKAGQQIAFQPLPNKTLADPDFNVSAAASSNLPVSFSANGNCTLTGAQVHLTGAGSCTITASQGGSSNYEPAPDVARSFNISKADQTISFGALSPKTFGDPDFTISATAASGLPVSFTASGQCAITASTVHLNSAGSCTITASQSGDAIYNAASDVAQSFNIGKAGSTTTVTVGNATYDGLTHGGTANVNGAGNLNQSLTIAYSGRNGTTYGPSTTAPTDAGDYTASVSFDGDESHDASGESKDFSIAKATATITLGDLNQTYTGTAKNATASTNPSGLSGITISYSQNGTPVASPVNSGSYDVLASLTNSNYQADNASGTLVINKAAATITLGDLTHTYDGSAKAANDTTDPAGLNVLISYSLNGQAIASPTNAGSYDVTASITDSNYQGGATAILVINKATPTLTWNNPANIASGTALSATQLNATANIPGTFTYDPPTGTLLSVGSNQLSVTFTPTDSANYTTALQSVQLMVEQLISTEINLSQDTYNANEADERVTITVNRTGDTTGAAAVNYATPDMAGLQNCSVFNGVASQRCDYAMTTGTLRFAPGETSKTIYIPLVDDSYAEGPESFNVTLSGAVGESLGTVSTATITITDNEATNGDNPVVNPSFFIRQHYIDFLNREPDPQGFSDWLNILNNCPQGSTACDRIEVSSAFFRSPEFRERGYFPYRFYAVSLGRKPNYSEFMPDLARVSGFLTEAEKEQARQDFIAEFMARAEFTSIYDGLSNPAYVQRLFETTGVTQVTVNGSVQTVETMQQQMAAGKSRAQVLREMVESAEVDAKFFTQAFVVMQYFGYLRRDPDALFTQWIETLDRTGDYRTMINGFVNSTEYVQRFGP